MHHVVVKIVWVRRGGTEKLGQTTILLISHHHHALSGTMDSLEGHFRFLKLATFELIIYRLLKMMEEWREGWLNIMIMMIIELIIGKNNDIIDMIIHL